MHECTRECRSMQSYDYLCAGGIAAHAKAKATRAYGRIHILERVYGCTCARSREGQEEGRASCTQNRHAWDVGELTVSLTAKT